MPWKPGTQILQHEMWGEGIGLVRPITVVEDSPERLAMYSHPMSTYASRGIQNRLTIPLSKRVDMFMELLDPGVGKFVKKVWSNHHVLILTPFDSLDSTYLFWTADWQLSFWYINLQAPLRRSSRGVQTHDYTLDIVVQPDMSWSWKDVDEFEELIKRGFFTDEQVTSIRADADRMVRTIESAGSPFSEGWENWRPDPAWPVPELPDDWADVGEAIE